MTSKFLKIVEGVFEPASKEDLEQREAEYQAKYKADFEKECGVPEVGKYLRKRYQMLISYSLIMKVYSGSLIFKTILVESLNTDKLYDYIAMKEKPYIGNDYAQVRPMVRIQGKRRNDEILRASYEQLLNEMGPENDPIFCKIISAEEAKLQMDKIKKEYKR